MLHLGAGRRRSYLKSCLLQTLLKHCQLMLLRHFCIDCSRCKVMTPLYTSGIKFTCIPVVLFKALLLDSLRTNSAFWWKTLIQNTKYMQFLPTQFLNCCSKYAVPTIFRPYNNVVLAVILRLLKQKTNKKKSGKCCHWKKESILFQLWFLPDFKMELKQMNHAQHIILWHCLFNENGVKMQKQSSCLQAEKYSGWLFPSC